MQTIVDDLVLPCGVLDVMNRVRRKRGGSVLCAIDVPKNQVSAYGVFDVAPVPGALVCNLGDMLERLTNHVYPSTIHRVVNPPGDAARQPRYSVPFFLHPNPDFLIDVLPSCITPDNPPMMNIAMNATAKYIGVLYCREPPHIVPIQLKIFTPVGMAMVMVARPKAACATGVMPEANM